MKKRVADIIIETLVELGVKDCFSVVGGGSMHLDNALGLNDDMNVVFHHHEQACAMAAEGYAKTSGNIAAVCVTSGPGATNTLTGVMGAWVDSVPMFVMSGQIRYEVSVAKTGLPLRFRGNQEFDIIGSVKNMTKYAKMVTDPLSIKNEINKAVKTAISGRRGPVWLDIPLDIQNAMVNEEDLYPVEEIKEEPTIKEEEFIKIENINGKLVLIGAIDDSLWNTAKYIRRMENRLKNKPHKCQEEIFVYEYGTHYVFPQSLIKNIFPLCSTLLLKLMFKSAKENSKECKNTRIDIEYRLLNILKDWKNA